ncbi:septin-7-like [Sycon ciliatum]|uniref:septin-7-like n=1 Tax=Sycon ciliatum TaxID=27933 RepID=UPI0020AA25F9|eukprot:scpid70731/ scgid9175/ Septin-7; CDC10 protein homolog &gt; Septin-7; CDC10 protein homolog &gt; Septin-7
MSTARNNVGFANLPNQVFRKSVQRGFEFSLMVVGQSGLGKSTLLNSLFLADIYTNADYPVGEQPRFPSTTKIQTSTVVLVEGGVQLKLALVDTPGFGCQVDNSNCWQPIVQHIDDQFEDYLNAESQIERVKLPDTRVHCCLYFIAPTGHGLKPLDIECMRQLHTRVNIVPVIAKADTMTPEECEDFKKKVMDDIHANDIQVHDFPDFGDDEEEAQFNQQMKDRLPFAIVGSSSLLSVESRKVRGRKYPWGVAEVENLEHCDFSALRAMIIRTHMQDLKEVTHRKHYETYRYSKLASTASTSSKGVAGEQNPLSQLEEEKKEHTKKMKMMQSEMETVFEMKVNEKKHKLKDMEADLERRKEAMGTKLQKEEQELDERQEQLEADRAEFEAQQRKYELDEAQRNLAKGKEKGGKGKKSKF